MKLRNSSSTKSLSLSRTPHHSFLCNSRTTHLYVTHKPQQSPSPIITWFQPPRHPSPTSPSPMSQPRPLQDLHQRPHVGHQRRDPHPHKHPSMKSFFRMLRNVATCAPCAPDCDIMQSADCLVEFFLRRGLRGVYVSVMEKRVISAVHVGGGGKDTGY